MAKLSTKWIACAWVCAATSSGCVDRVITDVDPIDPSGLDDGGDDGDGDGDDDGVVEDGPPPPEPACPDLVLDAMLPVEIGVDTTQSGDLFASACESASSPEASIRWNAPFDGTFAIQTMGSSFDPVLSVLDGVCGGPELACNDDGADLESTLQIPASAGQELTILVGSWAGETGTTTLRISAFDVGVCPDVELGDVVPNVFPDATLALDRTGSSCGGAGSPERLYGFTAPQAGIYAFGALDSDFDSVLYLQEGTCSFVELVCNDDLPGTNAAGLGYPLAEGQVVTIGVDALDAGGTFSLSIDRLRTEDCPFEFLGSDWPIVVTGDTLTGVNSAGSSCDGWFATDHTYAWIAPEPGAWIFTLVGSDYDAVLSVFDGDCMGAELGCTSLLALQSGSVVVEANAMQTLAIALDGGLGAGGSYTFSIDRYDGCAATDLPSDPMVSIVGSTAGRFADHDGSCAPTRDSPEVIYRYVPPFSGSYVIDTQGSSFDTVLYIREADCFGMELACNDDGLDDITSAVQVDLVEGQVYWVFVDGYAGEVGPFNLTIAAQ